jgi:hypothetical protein
LTGALTIYDLWRKTRRSPVPAAQMGPFITAQPQGMAGQILTRPDVEEIVVRPPAQMTPKVRVNDRA